MLRKKKKKKKEKKYLKIAGIIGIVISIWIFTDNKIMMRLIDQRFYVTTLLFASLIGSLVALLGIFGVLRKKKKCLKVVSFILFIESKIA